MTSPQIAPSSRAPAGSAAPSDALASPTLSELGYDCILTPGSLGRSPVGEDDDEIVWSIPSPESLTSPVLVDRRQGSDSGSNSTAGSPIAPYSTENSKITITHKDTSHSFDTKLDDVGDVCDPADTSFDDFVLVRGDYGSKVYAPPSAASRQRTRGHRSTQSESALLVPRPAPPHMRGSREVFTRIDGVENLEKKMDTIALANLEAPASTLARRRSTSGVVLEQTIQIPEVFLSPSGQKGKNQKGDKVRKGSITGPKDFTGAKESGSAVRSYPSPAPTPKPDWPDSDATVTAPKKEKKGNEDKKALGKPKPKFKSKPRAVEKFLREAPSPAPSTPGGLGTRSVVDDVSENGDALVQTVVETETERLLGMAYDEAVKFMNNFIEHPHYYTSKASRLTFLQALVVELGLVSTTGPTRALPGSLNSAKALLKTHAFLNVRDYLQVRGLGLEALRSAMFPSRSALMRDLRGRGAEGKKARRRAPLGWVKETGLTVLLVSCRS
ncbi:hypothetical protein DFH11DRAFT_1504835 [Phellopilus nigrolimitatus]|nr:hypothetical protein DFH11DRAFT_1504835 [Phellopilus nigrolimitatus]